MTAVDASTNTADCNCEAENGAAPAVAHPLYRIEELLGSGRRAVILHDNRRYLLTLTRRNRLILTLETPQAKAQD